MVDTCNLDSGAEGPGVGDDAVLERGEVYAGTRCAFEFEENVNRAVRRADPEKS